MTDLTPERRIVVGDRRGHGLGNHRGDGRRVGGGLEPRKGHGRPVAHPVVEVPGSAAAQHAHCPVLIIHGDTPPPA
jgi:hypothetical protein